MSKEDNIDKKNEEKKVEIVDNDGKIAGKIVGEAKATPEIVLASDILPKKIYLIPLVQRPAFPGIVLPMIFDNNRVKKLLRRLVSKGENPVVGMILAKNEHPSEDPTELSRQIYKIGTVVRILNINKTPDGNIQVIFQGVRRFEIIKTYSEGPHLVADVSFPKTQADNKDAKEIKAMTLGIINTLRELIKHNPIFSEEIKLFMSRGFTNNNGLLGDFAVNMTTADKKQLQEVLECFELKPRLEQVLFLLRKEQDINELKEKITKQIEEKLSKQQRDFFLKEQLKAIKEELGLEKDDKAEEIEKFRKRMEKLTMTEELEKVLEEEISKLQLLSPQSPEYGVSRNYIDWLVSLPWGISTKDHLDVGHARKILDSDHYGLKDVKERILEFIGVSKLKGSVEGSILCLVGPPGVGKTSLGQAVAKALGRKFFRFSLGGMRDEAEIKGHRRTYIGALPGKVMQAIKSCESQNPVIMLDEIDKVGVSFRGDPASALLEVLDPEENSTFRDHFLDVAFDLSKVLFIATANVPDPIPPALLDRMEVIKLSGYILEEKLEIAKRHLVPKQLKRHGLLARNIVFSKAGIRKIIDKYAREAGVRALEKNIKSCMRKAAARIAEKKTTKKCSINIKTVEDFLGKPVFHEDELRKKTYPGVATGLAWTPLGGSTLYIEAISVPGKYGIRQTGQLGEVMVESSNIAFSYVTAKYSEFDIPEGYFDKRQIHLHVPAGATKKDGPSAGITMATSLISLASGKSIPQGLAMTGELTLTGKVLPVGGIKEKVIAAKRAKITKIIMPRANEKDFLEIPRNVRSGLKIHYVEEYPEVYKVVWKK